MTAPVTFRPRTPDPVDASDLVTYREARARWDQWRLEHGFCPGAPLLTPPGANYKMAKGKYPTYGLTLAPARVGGRNVCADSTRQCRALCLATAGNGRYDSVTAARILRTRWLWADPVGLVSLAVGELERAAYRHRDDARIGVRWNVLSDIDWQTVAPVLLEPRPRVRAYDYTKAWGRVGADRYRLTYSRSELTPDADVVAAVESGRNVAVAFSTTRGQALPTRWLGCRVIDGDETDYRPGDPAGVIIGLRAKGRARDRRYWGPSGFVVDVGALS